MNQIWKTISSIEHAQIILVLAAVAILIAIAVYAVSWARGLAFEDPQESELNVTELQRLRSQGKISQEEFERAMESAIANETSLLKTPSEIKSTVDPKKPVKLPAGVSPNNEPPITLAEALARKKQQEAADDSNH